jgi:hypothetical protein
MNYYFLNLDSTPFPFKKHPNQFNRHREVKNSPLLLPVTELSTSTAAFGGTQKLIDPWKSLIELFPKLRKKIVRRIL